MSNSSSQPRGWYTRGYLPHFDSGELRSQFITFRLHDALPQKVLRNIRDEIKLRNPENVEKEKFQLIEKYADQGLGSCYLRDRTIAKLVAEALAKFDGERYKLQAWVIMPNHVHLLMRQCPGFALENILHSIKSFTASEANKILVRTGQFWMRESFDRYIRNGDHFDRVVRYIERNPVKAGLCATPEDWEFSSAFGRIDPAGSAVTELPE